jgi:hypothetical protein
VALVGTSSPLLRRRFGYYREQPEAEPEELEALEPDAAPQPMQFGPRQVAPELPPDGEDERAPEVTELAAGRNRRAVE